MAALTVHLVDLLRRGHETHDAEPADVVAAARLHLQRGDRMQAERLLRGLVAHNESSVCGECGRELSLICKRTGRWSEAVAFWRRMLEADRFDVFAAEELAKWLEHHEMRFIEALEVVEPALEALEVAEGGMREALTHRVNRLRRRIGKQPC